ncbi:hypothetical protein [Salipaludibacillus aurantiacus]|uniref:Uncharacterized protein n=1 Tax=Salipaludibacillus aurantiacus TaxID=1601833 RepID=A0A1H9VX73_9BACI|nr:hypothetical protein [Salipaludibacillus aurantiacus]SES25883.1 hypothetical protein SAMN05518684_1133 [Salipaludibacillus aurantiacus]
MECVGSILSSDKYELEKPLLVLEDKQQLTNYHGKGIDFFFAINNLDTRILTLFTESNDRNYAGCILVYDFKSFLSDEKIKEAIIWHEIGHLTYPAGKGNELDILSEIKCDMLAVKKAGMSGLEKLLHNIVSAGEKMNNSILINAANKRLEFLNNTTGKS